MATGCRVRLRCRGSPNQSGQGVRRSSRAVSSSGHDGRRLPRPLCAANRRRRLDEIGIAVVQLGDRSWPWMAAAVLDGDMLRTVAPGRRRTNGVGAVSHDEAGRRRSERRPRARDTVAPRPPAGRRRRRAAQIGRELAPRASLTRRSRCGRRSSHSGSSRGWSPARPAGSPAAGATALPGPLCARTRTVVCTLHRRLTRGPLDVVKRTTKLAAFSPAAIPIPRACLIQLAGDRGSGTVTCGLSGAGVPGPPVSRRSRRRAPDAAGAAARAPPACAPARAPGPARAARARRARRPRSPDVRRGAG
jgi:hypothetical protein